MPPCTHRIRNEYKLIGRGGLLLLLPLLLLMTNANHVDWLFTVKSKVSLWQNLIRMLIDVLIRINIFGGTYQDHIIESFSFRWQKLRSSFAKTKNRKTEHKRQFCGKMPTHFENDRHGKIHKNWIVWTRLSQWSMGTKSIAMNWFRWKFLACGLLQFFFLHSIRPSTHCNANTLIRK